MGYDFESERFANYENNISLAVELDKTCFSKEEYIEGNLNLKLKNGLQTSLEEPIAIFSLDEYHHYYYNINMEDKGEEEHYSLFSTKIRFPNFQGTNIMKKLKIPFRIQVPASAYPTCIFSKSSYVHHYLSVDFPSIAAKKTVVIVVKNNAHFTKENKLLLTPAIYFKEITKRSLLSENGSFTASLRLPVNVFPYEKKIPFEIYIDCSNLKTKISRVIVFLKRVERKNRVTNHSQVYDIDEKIITYKQIHLIRGLTKYNIQEEIKLTNNR